jgi:hypothetical protein
MQWLMPCDPTTPAHWPQNTPKHLQSNREKPMSFDYEARGSGKGSDVRLGLGVAGARARANGTDCTVHSL